MSTMAYTYDRRTGAGIRKILRVSPGNRLKTIPEAQRAAKAIQKAFSGVSAEFDGGALHVKAPLDKVDEVKKYIDKEYGAAVTEHGLSPN